MTRVWWSPVEKFVVSDILQIYWRVGGLPLPPLILCILTDGAAGLHAPGRGLAGKVKSPWASGGRCRYSLSTVLINLPLGRSEMVGPFKHIRRRSCDRGWGGYFGVIEIFQQISITLTRGGQEALKTVPTLQWWTDFWGYVYLFSVVVKMIKDIMYNDMSQIYYFGLKGYKLKKLAAYLTVMLLRQIWENGLPLIDVPRDTSHTG